MKVSKMRTKYNDVLVVDDEKVVCKNCEKILKEEGFSVTTALSGEECLKLIDERKYDAVILDLKIPDISGMEILRVIKEKRPGIKVIIISGYSSLENAVGAMKLGADDFIAKPFDPDTLSHSIKEALKKREIVAGEGNIIKPFIMKDEIEEKATESKYSEWTPVTFRPTYFSKWMGIQLGEDETARIVLNDLFFKLKGKVKYIDFPRLEEQINTDTPVFRIFYTCDESSYIQMEEVCSPISGKVIELNHLAIRNTNIVNESPFHCGWLIRVTPARFATDLSGLKPRNILIADDDKTTCESLVKYFREDIYNVYRQRTL